MAKLTIAQVLENVIGTLGTLTLTGEKDWSAALGCIHVLRDIQKQLDAMERQLTEVNEDV